jgi:hypothetical protein
MMVPNIREAVFADYDQIAALETATGLRAKPRDEWLHLWTNNPAYTASWPIGFVLEAEDGSVGGYIGNIPSIYHFRGRRLLTATGRSWAVYPALRAFGLLLLEEFFHQPGIDLFLSTTVNGQAATALTAFGFPRVPVGDWEHAAFWISNHLGFARSAARLKGLPGVASYPLAAALKVRSLFSRIAVPSGIRIEECAGFDSRFDAFWEQLVCSRPRVLIGNRTAESLAWHFHYPLTKGEVRILTASGGSGLLAYAIFMRRDVPEIGLERARLADFQQIGDGPSLLPVFIAGAIDDYRSEGVHTVEIVGTDPGAPYHRSLPAWSYYYRPGDPALAEPLSDASAWNPSSFDGDSSL